MDVEPSLEKYSKPLDNRVDADEEINLLRNFGAAAGVVSVGLIADGANAAAQHSDRLSNLVFYEAAGAYGVGGAILGAGIGLAISSGLGIVADVLSPYVSPLLGPRTDSDLGEDIKLTSAGAVIGGSVGAITGMALEQCGEGLYWLVTELS